MTLCWLHPARAVFCVLLVVVAGTELLAGQEAAPGMKRLDTGYGFSIEVPVGLERGPQAGNARLVLANAPDDFTVVVANFGPVQQDTVTAARVYRESFAKSGMEITTEEDVVVSSAPARRFVMKFSSPAGPGHAEAVLFPVGDEVFGVVTVCPAAAIDARRPVVRRVLDSIRIGE